MVNASPVRGVLSTLPFPAIAQAAAAAQLELAAVVDIAAAQQALLQERERLRKWQCSGCAGEMHYMQRDAELLTNLDRLQPGTQSIVSLLIPYRSSPGRLALRPGHGRVSRYAWGRDYHLVIADRLARFCSQLTATSGSLGRVRYFVDAVPLLERIVGRAAGHGFIGKNTLLIKPGLGSYFFIAEVLLERVVTDFVLPQREQKGSCGTCTRCLNNCPTGAFAAEGILDSRKCISYLSIEKRGPFSTWEAEALGEWLFGCDVCQEVCPFNHASAIAPADDELSKQSGVGSQLDLNELLELSSDRAFIERFADTALLRSGRAGLLRNALAVAANTHALETLPLIRALVSGDSSSLVRVSAGEALKRLSRFETGNEGKRVRRSLDNFIVPAVHNRYN